MSDLDLYAGDAYLPEGPTPGADLQMIQTAVVLATDAVTNRVQVLLNNGALWLGAVPGMYTPGRTCWVLCNPLMGGRAVLVLGQVNGAATELSTTARLVSIDATAKTAVVTLAGANYTIPYIPSAYTAGALVWVLRNPSKWGAPELMLGPWDVAAPPVPEVPLVPPVPPEGGTVQVTTTIRPQWSGTWRTIRGAWDRWNEAQFGGRSDLYQGNAFGSGPLTGLATYGDQLVNLGAISIDAVTVALIHNGGSGMPGAPTVQGSPHGSQPGGAPSSSGDTSTGTLTASMRENLRTGAIKGLALVGAGYVAVRGTSHPEGMALTITYTRRT